MILTNVKERNRFLKFAVVGLVGAVIDFGVFNLLTATVTFFKQNAIYAQGISFSLAVISNFIWNRFWTYPDSRTKPLRNQLGQFILVSAIGLAIRTPVFAILEKILVKFVSGWWKSSFLTPTFIGHNVSLALVIGLIMLWNFFVNRYWTYNDVSA